MEEKGSRKQLHVVVFPWLAFGHMLPFLELSKKLARRGHRVSYISTPKNIQRLPELPADVSHLVAFVPLALPKVEGLPETAEATSDVPSDSVENLKLAFDGLAEKFKGFIETANPKPDWIIQDFAQYWLPEIAADAGVPSVFLSIVMANCLVYFGPPSGAPARATVEEFAVPPPWVPFPSNLRLQLHEARRLVADSFKPNTTGYADSERVNRVVEACRAVAVRSCPEVEPEWLPLLSEIYGKPVIPVGLLPPQGLHLGGDGGAEIMQWLDEQRARSVLYIAFGSEASLSEDALRELTAGVELAKLPFVWALRGQRLPEGFEQRTESYGMVKSWVPQLKILAHESVGGFLTHSGWSSVIESLQFGHPLVLLPIANDQGLNARVIMEKGIAVKVERDEGDGSFTREAVAAALRAAVVGEEGEACRRRAEELKGVLFTGEEARQEKYVDDFVDYLVSSAE